MKHQQLSILTSLPQLLLPRPALAASTGSLDYWTLSVFMTVNFLITAGLFGLGILLIGLFQDHLRPWFKDRRKQNRERKQRYSS